MKKEWDWPLDLMENYIGLLYNYEKGVVKVDYDVIILGAGSMGMAAGYYLTRAGKKVLLIDKNDPPHTYGSHHGSTRLIRHAYGEGDYYVNLALRSQQLWLELQKLVEEKLFIPTGVLNVGRSNSDFIQNVIGSAEAFSLPVEVLSADEINERWKGWSVPEDYIGCFEISSGVLLSERIISAYRKVSEKIGAVIKVNTSVTSVKIKDDLVEVETPSETYTSKHLIVASGAGTSEISRLLGITLPLTEIRKTFSWFNCDEENYGNQYFPAFAFSLDKAVYYGFPSIESDGVKIGRHDGGRQRDMKEPLQGFGAFSEDEGDVTQFARCFFSNLGSHKEGAACTYTMTPDEDFIIDAHPEYDNVFIACGFSGHGFKFSSAVGEMLCQMVTSGETELDMSRFALDRFNQK